MVALKGFSVAGIFRNLSKYVFCSPQPRKHIRYEGHLFFQNNQNLMLNSGIEQKFRKKFQCVIKEP